MSAFNDCGQTMDEYIKNLQEHTSVTLAKCGDPSHYREVLAKSKTSRRSKKPSRAKSYKAPKPVYMAEHASSFESPSVAKPVAKTVARPVAKTARKAVPTTLPAAYTMPPPAYLSPVRAVPRYSPIRTSPCILKGFSISRNSCFLDSSLFSLLISHAFEPLFKNDLRRVMTEFKTPTGTGRFLNPEVRNTFRAGLGGVYNNGHQQSADELLRVLLEAYWPQNKTTVIFDGVPQPDPIITVHFSQVLHGFLRGVVVVGEGLIVTIVREKNTTYKDNTMLSLDVLSRQRDAMNHLCVLQSMVCHRSYYNTIRGGHYNVIYWCGHDTFMYDNTAGTARHSVSEDDLRDVCILFYVRA
jgi:hypothetical protein